MWWLKLCERWPHTGIGRVGEIHSLVNMTFTLELPTGPIVAAALNAVNSSVSVSIVNHSIRSFLFATILADRQGALDDAAYDPTLLFAATVMHDLGTGSAAPGETRFELEGADLAAEALKETAASSADIDRVWEAIALHTSPGIANRRGLLSHLTRSGIEVDFGLNHTSVQLHQAAIHAAYPRLDMTTTLVDAIVAQAARSASNAPEYSLPGDLLRERTATGTTNLEQGARGSVWGS